MEDALRHSNRTRDKLEIYHDSSHIRLFGGSPLTLREWVVAWVDVLKVKQVVEPSRRLRGAVLYLHISRLVIFTVDIALFTIITITITTIIITATVATITAIGLSHLYELLLNSHVQKCPSSSTKCPLEQFH